MPPKRNQCRKTNKPSTAGTVTVTGAGAIDNCVLPPDVMVSILARLPVKSILQFKSVCKPWCKLFATQRFLKLHHAQFSENPENMSVIIYSLSDYHDHTMSLFRIESDENKPVTLDHPYPEIFFRMDFVGSYNGLVCMGCPPLGQCIVLWNPAMKLFKMVRLSKAELGAPEMVSLGFGYDDEGDDFKVVRVVNLKEKANKLRVGAEVYSTKSDSWKTLKLGIQFNVMRTQMEAIVNGNPYWFGKVDENAKNRHDKGGVVVCFDVKKMVFRVMPLPSNGLRRGEVARLVNWKGSLGFLVFGILGEERVESLDVWVLDDDGVWGKKHAFGPVDLKVDRFLQCLKNGMFVGEFPDGKLFVYNPKNGLVKEIVIDEARKRSFVVEAYAESLACIEGMKKVVAKTVEGSVGDVDGYDGPEGEVGEVVEVGEVDMGSLLMRAYLQQLNVGI